MFIELVMPSNHLILCCCLLFLISIFPSIRVFPMNQIFTPGGQCIGASASPSVPLLNIQSLFPSGLIGLISLLSKELSGVFSSATIQKHQFFGAQLSLMVQLSHLYMTTGKTIALTVQTFAGKGPLLFNTLSRFIIAFFARIRCLLISWLQSSSTVILEPKKIKSVTASTFPSSICHEAMGPDAMILGF